LFAGAARLQVRQERRWPAASAAISLLVTLLIVLVPASLAADSWTSSPYRARVWLMLPTAPEFQDAWQSRLPRSLTVLTRSYFGAAMTCDIVFAAPSVDVTEVRQENGIPLRRLAEVDADIGKLDKLFVVSVEVGSVSGIGLMARELDCGTRLWGPVYSAPVDDISRIDWDMAAAIRQVFRPVGRVARVQKQSVELEMRSGLLSELSAATIVPAANAILQPVTRRTDRLGQVAEDGIQAIPWTILQVIEAQQSDDIPAGNLLCKIDSGLRAPLRARTSRRVDRLALLVTPTYERTVFKLQTEEAPPRALAGYELHARLPKEKKAVFVGRSDWTGKISVARDRHPYKIFYVKHGNVLLARLPCAVGLDQELTITLPDHRERLKAEAFARGIEDDLLDLVARREIAAAKIRRQLRGEVVTAENITAATHALAAVQKLNRGDGLLRAIQRREATFASDNRAVQRRIDLLFSSLRQSIRQTMSPSYIAKLETEIDETRQRVRPQRGAEPTAVE
jgi:hypothetical protein